MMSEYSPKNIQQMLYRRQLGLPLKEKGRAVRHNRNNYRCDYELLKTLLSDRQLYLEVIACRKVSRRDEPSFCHNRLFTNKYRSWFNLCTSPTAGPSLMKTNVFAPDHAQSHESLQNCRLRIVDAVTLDPPNGCVPLPNSQHLPCILFLCKDQWLYQYSLQDASCLNKIYIPGCCFVDELSESYPTKKSSPETDYEECTRRINFNYQYMTVIAEEGRVLVRSVTSMHGCDAYVAYALLGLFPLRLISHFVTKSNGTNLKAELWNDLFVLTSNTGSTVSLYGLKDIEALRRLDSSHVQLGKKLYYWCRGSDNYLLTKIGEMPTGLPYTTKVIELGRWREWSNFLLFKTKAPKHIFRVGGVPFHYAIPIDRNCTCWSLRSLTDNKEVSKFHVDEKWDNSPISGFSFHSDDSGRILLVNKDTITVYKMEQTQVPQPSLRPDHACISASSSSSRSVTLSKYCPAKTINKRHIAKPSFQLRVIGSVHSATPTSNVKSKVTKCFEIKVNHKERERSTSSLSADGDKVDIVSWQYPSERPDAVRSSYGRTLRQTQHYDPNGPEFGVLSVSYENELDILAVLHLKLTPDMPPNFGIGEVHYDLAVSLYDNISGAKINSVVVERDLTPGDACDASIIMDEDTLVYTRTENADLLSYKIMRFCRKF